MTIKPRLPSLRAVGPDDEPEGFPVVTIDVTDVWHIETDGMRASDIGDTMTSEGLARLFAAAPDLLLVCERLIELDLPHCRNMLEAAIAKARGEP